MILIKGKEGTEDVHNFLFYDFEYIINYCWNNQNVIDSIIKKIVFYCMFIVFLYGHKT